MIHCASFTNITFLQKSNQMLNHNYYLNRKIVLLMGDLVLVFLALYISVYIRYLQYINISDVYTGATVLSIIIYLFSFYILDLYNLKYKFTSTSYMATFIIAVAIGTILISVFFYFLPSWRFGRGISLINMVMITVSVYLWRLAFESVFALGKIPKSIVIIGAGRSGRMIYDVLKRSNAYAVKGFIDDDHNRLNERISSHKVIGDSSCLMEMARKGEIDAVVIAITNGKGLELLNNILDTKMHGVEVHLMADMYGLLTGKLPIKHLNNSWLVYTSMQGVNKCIYMTRLKRLKDIVLSVIGLILSLPIIILAPIFIKLDSKGPILYMQKRVGYDGEVFELLKFRSMRVDAERNGPEWAQENDLRVTMVGKVLRKTRIDEIPQLWNVLRGSMSFIGPRPERPEFVRQLANEMPFYHLRHNVKPGITGWAQINFRYGASAEDAFEKLQYDLFYIKNLSLLLDIQILLRTFKIVFLGNGAR